MMSSETIRNIIGVIGNIISLVLFLAPLPTFTRILRVKDVEQFSPFPYLATLLNCMLWVFYGMPFVHPNSVLILTINGAGIVLEGIYLVIFFIYAPKHVRMKMVKILGGEIVFVAAVASLVLSLAHTHSKRTFVVGILCVIFGILMYASPLSVMAMVIKTKSVKYMPFTLSFVSFFNGVCWTAYAVIKFDIFVTIPNAVGTGLCAIQLIIYACYCRNSPNNSTQEIQMSSHTEP